MALPPPTKGRRQVLIVQELLVATNSFWLNGWSCVEVFRGFPQRQMINFPPPAIVPVAKFYMSEASRAPQNIFVRKRQLFEQKLSMKMQKFNYWLARNKTP